MALSAASEGRFPVITLALQQAFRNNPVEVEALIEFLEHPPYSGSFTIHAARGKINHAERKEIVQAEG